MAACVISLPSHSVCLSIPIWNVVYYVVLVERDPWRIADEMGQSRGRAVFAGADRCGHWRPLESAGAARVLPAHQALRGIPVAPLHHAASARRPAEEVREVRRAQAREIPGSSRPLRIHTD